MLLASASTTIDSMIRLRKKALTLPKICIKVQNESYLFIFIFTKLHFSFFAFCTIVVVYKRYTSKCSKCSENHREVKIRLLKSIKRWTQRFVFLLNPPSNKPLKPIFHICDCASNAFFQSKFVYMYKNVLLDAVSHILQQFYLYRSTFFCTF